MGDYRVRAMVGGDTNDTNDDVCAICLETLSTQHCETLVGCGHRFHSACIVPALQHNRACPMCRYCPESPSEDFVDFNFADDNEAELASFQEWLHQQQHAITRAFRSSISRARRGTASASITSLARQYRRIGPEVQRSARECKEARRELDRVFRAQRAVMRTMARDHEHESRALRRRVVHSDRRHRALLVRRADLRDALAMEGGYHRGGGA